ncbi:GntR family transcriptional regulator [Micromonospora sp. WMMD737]|uniref:GntR family transcriptional regulator n=1 Tax=Micromonospora sp. WMMD737 TaxID=3404113 RepID=UPI003B92E61D
MSVVPPGVGDDQVGGGQIASGELPPGEKLLSTSELCQIHGVSAIVVRNAMLTLKAEGLVVGVPGVGVFVVDE